MHGLNAVRIEIATGNGFQLTGGRRQNHGRRADNPRSQSRVLGPGQNTPQPRQIRGLEIGHELVNATGQIRGRTQIGSVRTQKPDQTPEALAGLEEAFVLHVIQVQPQAVHGLLVRHQFHAQPRFSRPL